ncbi:unnamed protein product [Effrenium voratum]|nr:unnamed protein product [Effrenium voratum]
MSPTGDAIRSSQLVQQGGDFSLHEFALRVWLACETGASLADMARRLQITGEVSLSLGSFQKVCGQGLDSSSRDPSKDRLSVAPGGGGGGGSSRRSLPSVRCQPALSEGEALAAYGAFQAKYRQVTLAAVRMELSSNSGFSDVLALDRACASMGETLVVRYRLPRELQSQTGKYPFIAVVPSSMTWMSGGGGCWMLNRMPVTEMTGPKFFLKKGEGVIRLQVWPGVASMELGSADLRIFSSPDGISIGKQLGGSARFELCPAAPSRLMVEEASVGPSSLRLVWEPPGGKDAPMKYIIRGRALNLDVEESTMGEETLGWSHVQKKVAKFQSHHVSGLLPGARYQFQVHAVLDVRRRASSASLTSEPTAVSPQVTPRVMSPERSVSLASTVSVASPTVEVTMPTRPAPPQPGRAFLLSQGLGGSLTLRWHTSEGEEPFTNAAWFGVCPWDYELFWDQENEDNEESEEGEAHKEEKKEDQDESEIAHWPDEDQKHPCRVWRYPYPFWIRKLPGGLIECLVHPPAGDSARWAVRAVDAVSGEVSVLGDLSLPVPLPSLAEALLREEEAPLQKLGEAAVAAGGWARYLEEAEDKGLLGTGDQNGLDLRRKLFAKVEDAGGVQKVVEALEDLNMETFVPGCQVMKAIQDTGRLDSDSWQKVVKLVAGAGGAEALHSSLQGIELGDVIGHAQELAALGIFEGQSQETIRCGTPCWGQAPNGACPACSPRSRSRWPEWR